MSSLASVQAIASHLFGVLPSPKLTVIYRAFSKTCKNDKNILISELKKKEIVAYEGSAIGSGHSLVILLILLWHVIVLCWRKYQGILLLWPSNTLTVWTWQAARALCWQAWCRFAEMHEISHIPLIRHNSFSHFAYIDVSNLQSSA